MFAVAVEHTLAPVVPYTDAWAPVPAPAAWPLPSAVWEEFVDADVIVTFCMTMPFDKAVNGRLTSMQEHVREAFGGKAYIANPEFRVIGARSGDDFDRELCGEIDVQVSGGLVSHE